MCVCLCILEHVAFIQVGDGTFSLRRKQTGETLVIRNLGTEYVEFVNHRPPGALGVFLMDSKSVTQFALVGECFGRFEAAGAFFTSAPNGEVSGELHATQPEHACTELSAESAAAVRGRVALVERGACTFMNKVERLVAAGALAVVVVNTLERDSVFMMGGDGSDKLVPVPALMVTQAAGRVRINLLVLCAVEQGLGPLSGGTACLFSCTCLSFDFIRRFCARAPPRIRN